MGCFHDCGFLFNSDLKGLPGVGSGVAAKGDPGEPVSVSIIHGKEAV